MARRILVLLSWAVCVVPMVVVGVLLVLRVWS